MTDLISRQAAIDEWKNDFKGYVNALNIPRDDYRGIMEYIDELPSAEPHWIPCSERMPEEDGVYLVYAPEYRGGSSSSKEWHDGVMFAKCKNGKWSIEHGYYSRPNCVMAWMPLPEPYEAKDEKTD